MTTQNRNRIEPLIERALDAFNIEDLATVFLEKIDNWKQRELLVKTMLEDKEIKSDFISELEGEILQDRIVIEVKEMTKIEKIKAFLTTEIFPFYNEQQTALTF